MIDLIARTTPLPTNNDKVADNTANNIKTYVKEVIKEDTYQKSSQVTKKDLKEFLEFLNDIPIFKDKLNFGFSDDIGQLLVLIKDKSTEEIIRQYPSEEFINRVLYYRDNIGILFDIEA